MTVSKRLGNLKSAGSASNSSTRTRLNLVVICLIAASLGCSHSEDNGGNSPSNGPSQTETIQLASSPVGTSGTTDSGTSSQQDGVDSELQDAIDSTKSHYPAVRIEAYEKLGGWPAKMGSAELKLIARKLIEIRADEYNDFDDRYIDLAFRSLNDKAVAEVERLIATQDADNIMQAVVMMRALGETFCEKLTPTIDTLLKSDNPDHVWQGMYTLEGMGDAGKGFIDQVFPHTQSSDFQAQQIALRVLATIGPEAKEHLAEVRRLADEGQNLSVKSHAMIAMGKISAGGDEAKSVAEQLAGYLDANSFIAKQRALTGLIALKGDATAAQAKAKSMMDTDKSGLAAQAAYVYGLTSGDWEASVKKLAELTRDPTVGFEALDYLQRIGPNAKDATEMLLTMTRSQDESLSGPAVEALKAIYRQPQADDENFQKVAKRFAEVAEEVTETGYIAEEQLQQWKKSGLINSESTQESK